MNKKELGFEKKQELVEIIMQGQKAEDLKEFVDEWMKAEEQRAISELLNTSRDPALIKADLQADARIAGYIVSLINKGKMVVRDLKENNDE